MGKMVRIDNQHDLKVTRILIDPPYNSTLRFDYLIPFAYSSFVHDYEGHGASSSYDNNSFAIYVKLKPGVSYESWRRN